MTMTSLGDLAHAFALRRQNTSLKLEMQAASAEMVSGRTSDAGQALRGDFAQLSAIDSALARLGAYRATTAETALAASAMQAALGTITELAADLSANLLANATGAQTVQVAALGGAARQGFLEAVAAVNTGVGDQSLFSGTEPGRPPLPDGDTVLAALSTAVTGVASAQDMATAVRAWFDAPDGYAALYAGGPARSAVAIAPGVEASLDITAQEPALRDTLAGLAMAALLDLGALAPDPAARRDLARLAGVDLAEGATARTMLSARLGLVEGRVETATARNAAEETTLSLARNRLLEVDPYEAAVRLQDAETRLQSLYTVTARLSRLSLADYL